MTEITLNIQNDEANEANIKGRCQEEDVLGDEQRHHWW